MLVETGWGKAEGVIVGIPRTPGRKHLVRMSEGTRSMVGSSLPCPELSLVLPSACWTFPPNYLSLKIYP